MMSEMISVASGFQYSVNIGYDLNNDAKLMMIIMTMSTSLMDAQLVKRKFFAHSSHRWQQTLMKSSLNCQISFSDRL